MTVSTEVSREEYTGNGVTTDFDYRFRVFSAEDLVVSVADTTETITVLTLNTDYTVTGAGSRSGGKVKLSSPLAFNWRISIERSLPATQETDVRNQGNFFPEVHEDAWDKLTMLVQQIRSALGLALRKPSWLARYYDALGNRIANLGNPVNQQDAAPKSYVDSVSDDRFSRTLRVPESYVSPLPSAAQRANKVPAFDSLGNPVVMVPASGSAADVMIELAKNTGASKIGTPFGTVLENIRNCANIVSFDAEMIPADATAAFSAAYATGKPVYVPPGSWFTSDYRREKLFGDGIVYSDDNYFSDEGQRPVSPSPETGRAVVEHLETWGNKERAAARGLIVNNSSARTQVSGFSDPSQYATYVNSDHVGQYLGMYGPRNQIVTLSTASYYTVNTLTAPEVVSENDIRVGMFISTSHSPRYKAKIISIDFHSNTIEVDGWYAAGNPSPGQIPQNGYSSTINAADKMWGHNTVIFIDDDSSVKTATGFELGFQIDTTPGNPVWGFHCANYGQYDLPQGFRVTGLWDAAYYTGSGSTFAFRNDVGKKSSAGLYIQNLDSDNWTGSALKVNTNFRKSSSKIISVVSGGVSQFDIDTRGVRNVQRESVAVVSNSTSITGLSPSVILCNNSLPINININNSGYIPGQIFDVRAFFSDVTIAGITLNDSNGRYARFVYDGTTFIALIHV
ncbi:hypothetical protein [Serratia fonticola]|uniref:hypothetical protein n=1 Tax=Serratia fonticola TaxID=47917 RepID=UPI003AAF9F07